MNPGEPEDDYHVEFDEKEGNKLIKYPVTVTREQAQIGLNGEWELTVCIDQIEHYLVV